jgi:inner membrane protein
VPTILTHPVVPLALGIGLGTRVVSLRLLFAGIVASVLPDADVLAFWIGVSYSHELGHRGITHSLMFALALALLALACAPQLRARRPVAFLFVLVATASHGLLDMLTNGGLGVALLWPLAERRFFFPVQPIEVSPLGLRRFLSPWGLAVVLSELRWVWLPCTVIGLAILLARRAHERMWTRAGMLRGSGASRR